MTHPRADATQPRSGDYGRSITRSGRPGLRRGLVLRTAMTPPPGPGHPARRAGRRERCRSVDCLHRLGARGPAVPGRLLHRRGAVERVRFGTVAGYIGGINTYVGRAADTQ
jgi:hypothetical protein